MVGWPRVVGIKPMPSRAALRAKTARQARQIEPWLTNDDFRRFKWWREAERDFQPFHQRMFFAAHPDLSYTSLNGDVPLTTSPHHQEGVLERMQLIRDKMPGVEDIIMRLPPHGAGQLHVMQACALDLDRTPGCRPGDEPLADGPDVGRRRHAHGARALGLHPIRRCARVDGIATSEGSIPLSNSDCRSSRRARPDRASGTQTGSGRHRGSQPQRHRAGHWHPDPSSGRPFRPWAGGLRDDLGDHGWLTAAGSPSGLGSRSSSAP